MKGRTFLTTLLIGILCLSLLLAGCGSKEPVDQSGESSSGEADSGSDTASGGESNFNSTGYPIVKEKVTLTALVNNYSADFPDDCFLQEKIPHFCKDFSPGTGGEFFC